MGADGGGSLYHNKLRHIAHTREHDRQEPKAYNTAGDIHRSAERTFCAHGRCILAMEFYKDNERGREHGGVHGYTNSVPYSRLVAADVHDLADRPYRRDRAPAFAAEKDKSARARAGDDDDDSAEIHTDAYRGNG